MVFAYSHGRRWFAWEVQELPTEIRDAMDFRDSLRSGAYEVSFRRGHPRSGSKDVRPTFCYFDGQGGRGESLTHLLFKEAFLSVKTIALTGVSKRYNPLEIELTNVQVEYPIYVDASKILRVDVHASVSSPDYLMEYWGYTPSKPGTEGREV